MRVDYFIKAGTFALTLFLASSVYAAECSQRVKDSTAKSLANRDNYLASLTIARANQQLEITRQQALTSAVREKYDTAISGASSYTSSVRPKIIQELTKQKEKALQKRTKDETRVLKNAAKAVESAEKSYNRAANKVSNNLGCTL